jgi:hypothetical protein
MAHVSSTRRLLLLGAALVLLLAACPGGSQRPCGECRANEVCDEATDMCVRVDNGNGQNGGNGTGNGYEGPLPCGSDFDDCGEGEVCDLGTGECIAGQPCDPDLGEIFDTNANCNWNADAGTSDPGFACGGTHADDCVCDPTDGTCKRRRQTCEPCTDDEECGPHSHFGEPAECAEYDGSRVCLVKTSPRGCPAGYLPEGDHCVPAEGSCEAVFACTSDADCPEERPLCHRASGTCRAGCGFDLATGDSIGCPPEQVCHGDGRCRAECDGPAECQEIHSSFVCYQEPTGPNRCRIDGCLADRECEVPSEGYYTGLCDLGTNACVYDRCETDDHCRLPAACDAGQCRPMTCLERLAPSVACGANQFCCEFCRNATDNPDRDACDPTPCTGNEPLPDGSAEGCFTASTSQWCQGCGEDSDCAGLSNPKEDARDENVCFDDRCALTCETALDCPTRWQCQSLYRACETNDDCGTGQCVAAGDGDDAPMFCDCASGGAGSDDLCPDGTRCAFVGGGHWCIVGKVCFEQLGDDEDSYCG